MNTTKHEKNNILLQFWVKETPFKKKKVSVWHTMKWTSRLWLPKNSGSLHIMIFRYCGNISVSMQRYFLKVKGVKKFMFRCHTLTHGTDLRRLPLKLIPWNKNWGCSLHTQRLFFPKPQPNLNCWESHGTFLKVFLHKILAQAPILQLVAFSSNMLHYASIFNFYRHSRPGTLLGKSWKIFGIVPLTQFFDIIFFFYKDLFLTKNVETLFSWPRSVWLNCF